MFTERSVKGTERIKADRLAYLGDGLIGIYQHFTRRRDSEGVYIVVKSDAQFITHYMGYIVFIEVQVVG